MIDYEVWDVFTDTAFTGNPLAIVPDALGLSTRQMQQLTRQFNLSETIFLLPPESDEQTARARIFFPGGEMPFAGHPTVGGALYLARAKGAKTVVLGENAGDVPVEITGGMARFIAPVIPKPTGSPVYPSKLARSLGIEELALGPDNPGVHGGGVPFLYAPVQGLSALADARPCEPCFSSVLDQAGVDSVYVYTRLDAGRYRARMFSPTAGIPEDPATGSAAVGLASQLNINRILKDGVTDIRIEQGVEMGRPSEIHLRIVREANLLTRIEIAGRAVPVAKGRIKCPTIDA